LHECVASNAGFAVITPTSVLHDGAVVMERGRSALELVQRRAPESVDALEAYAEALESWKRVFDEALSSESSEVTDYIEVAKEISDQHDTIVAAAKELHGDLGSSIKNLGGWIKGVRAYVGGSVERITTMRPKKG
jgi:hypothetical protein